jgi:ubiquitin carboxyl-terminal hydrolase 10
MMNGRHLPAGQGMQQDIGRRRSYNHPQYQPVTPVYNGYMNPYSAFYSQVTPQYQHGGIPPVQYPPYPAYGRSPPPQFQQYAHTPTPVVSAYSRPQHSPAVVSTPYQPPPPQTPVSSHSSSTVPPLMTPPTPQAPQIVTPTRSPFQPPVSS